MSNEIISYQEMCQREAMSLQRGMNFRRGAEYSIILMSLRPNAPYRDAFENDGATLIYEGHDIPSGQTGADPKLVDQPEFTANGSLTENGKFYMAAQAFKRGEQPSRPVRVYEKIKDGIWSYNGIFKLRDAWQEFDGHRNVFKFKLSALEERLPSGSEPSDVEYRRIIPTAVKLEVWKRDKGRCVECGSTQNLHFDHIIPYSKGGSSETAANIQILCAKHNLSKHADIK